MAVTKADCSYILMDESLTRYGAIETMEEGDKYAAFLKEHEGEYDGVILSLPNFGDENGAAHALRDCGVPIKEAFFGYGGVARIAGLQDKLLFIGKNGFRHHVSATRSDCLAALNEAFETYLKYDLTKL